MSKVESLIDYNVNPDGSIDNFSNGGFVEFVFDDDMRATRYLYCPHHELIYSKNYVVNPELKKEYG